jgi:hypothetical protein
VRFGRPLLLAVLLVVAAPLAAAMAAPSAAPSAALSGHFQLAAGTCDGAPAGSYFRMILKTGTAAGPFFSNNDSACGDKTFTLLTPGADGGLVPGAYQSEPTPAFDGSGNALADRIIQPTKFFGINFSASTNPTDPQSRTPVPTPVLSVGEDGSLTGDLRSFGASWNGQEFNQGAPKPDSSTPGLTAAPSGTLDSQSGAFTLEWRSQIVGGAFDGFTGVWHLEGTFVPDTTPTTADATPAVGDPSVPDNADDPTLSTNPSPASSTSTTIVGLPTSTPVTGRVGAGQVASPTTVKLPGVVVARASGGSSGKGWVAVPAGIAALGVGAIAVRVLLTKQRGTAP